ncbi:hypothetical protein EYB53_020510 [Candidatus Chloroploca sp. M-50]|uniref:Uncharacterized protein n=1 Tax=Candidatus Chloroploca mongolica TaxID=2528176 RepID=A0ABS4DF90_9CHLR|nr:hypothetical protein [Candidatus Chloroploca mongolica]MBP1468108.1 hypothetical protein [Candidatus Chloroploca mongolica]
MVWLRRSLSSSLILTVVVVAIFAIFFSGFGIAASRVQGTVSTADAIGSSFTYRGQLQSADGPVSTTCDFQFELWDAESDGAQIGATQSINSVAVQEGLFAVTLNGGGEFGPDAFSGAARWLEISVRCPQDALFTILAPRQALTASPYAITSASANGLRGHPVGDAQPAEGQVLGWDGTQWLPQTLPTDIATTALLEGSITTASPGELWVGPLVTVTTTVSQRITMSASVSVATLSDTATLLLLLCYLPEGSSQGASAQFIQEVEVNPSQSLLPAATTITPGPGTWLVGICLQNTDNTGAQQLELRNNGFVHGWVMVTN